MVNKELTKFYGAVLRSPWMSEEVKIAFKISRRDILLLCQLIERGLESDDAKSFIPAEAFEDLRNISTNMLSNAAIPEEFSQSSRDLTLLKLI